MNRRILITKSAMEKYMQKQIPDSVWDYLNRHTHVSEANSGEHPDSFGWLGKHVDELLGLCAQPVRGFVPQRRSRRIRGLDLRREVISELLAGIARRRPEVSAFRERFLQGQILRPADVQTWIESRVQETAYPHAAIVRLPQDCFPRSLPNGQLEIKAEELGELQVERVASIDFLDFAGPQDSWIRSVPIGRDGVLRQLFNVSKELARILLWQEAQATIFVLTDMPPLLSTHSVTIHPGPAIFLQEDESAGNRTMHCLTRISMTFDPLISAEELEEQYRKLRAALLEHKPRSLSEKHMRLAGFCAGYRELNETVMEEWNTKFPKWMYTRLSQFSWHAKMAKERLLYQPAFDVWRPSGTVMPSTSGS